MSHDAIMWKGGPPVSQARGPATVPKRFTDEQVTLALREMEAGVSVGEVCRRHGVSERTIYRWRRERRALELVVPGPGAPRHSVQLASARLQLEALRFALRSMANELELEKAVGLIRARFRMSTRRARSLVGLEPRRAGPAGVPD